MKVCTKPRKQQHAAQDDDLTAAGLAEGAGIIGTGTASLAWGALVNVVEWLVTPRSRDAFGCPREEGIASAAEAAQRRR